MSAAIPDERARKNHQAILNALASVGQVRLAESMGVSEATVSRWKGEQSEQCARALSALGLKCVPIEMRCFDPKKVDAILELAKSHLADIEKSDQLAWDQ
jgi:Bacteriophage CII protein